jgi:ArsR family transcriptional regulator
MVSLLLDSLPDTSHAKTTEADLDVASLPADTGHTLAGLFKLLADETRLRIIYFLLQKDEINVRTFCNLLGQSQPAVSHHLAMLKEAGLLDSRRDGKHNFYRVVPKRAKMFVDVLFGGPPDQPRRFQLDDNVLTYSRAGQ